MKALALTIIAALALAGGATAKGGGKLQGGSQQLYQLTWVSNDYGATSTTATFSVERIKRQPQGTYPVQLALSCGQTSTLIYGDQADVSSTPVTVTATIPLSIPGNGCLAWVYTLNGDPAQNPYYPESSFVAIAYRL